MLLNKQWFATKPMFSDNTGNVFYLSMFMNLILDKF